MRSHAALFYVEKLTKEWRLAFAAGAILYYGFMADSDRTRPPAKKTSFKIKFRGKDNAPLTMPELVQGPRSARSATRHSQERAALKPVSRPPAPGCHPGRPRPRQTRSARKPQSRKAPCPHRPSAHPTARTAARQAAIKQNAHDITGTVHLADVARASEKGPRRTRRTQASSTRHPRRKCKQMTICAPSNNNFSVFPKRISI